MVIYYLVIPENSRNSFLAWLIHLGEIFKKSYFYNISSRYRYFPILIFKAFIKALMIGSSLSSTLLEGGYQPEASQQSG